MPFGAGGSSAVSSLSRAALPDRTPQRIGSLVRNAYGNYVSQPDPNTPGAAQQRAYDFGQIARNNGFGGSYNDPYTGAHYEFPSGGGSGSGPRASDPGGYEEFDLDFQRAANYFPAPAPAAPPPARVPNIHPTDPTAANSAAFSRAKDRIGKLGRGAVDSLTRAMGNRGIAGSSIEGRGLTDIVESSQGELADVVRDQAVEGFRRESDVADRNYAGDLSQRSADMGYATTTRGQDIDAATSRFSQLQGLISLLRAGRRRAY
jgi:hypothetical protein